MANITADSYEAVASVWINDRELVEWAKNEYGLPAVYSKIEISHETGPKNQTTWEWGLAGRNSTLTSGEVPAMYGGFPYNQRFVWANATSLYLWDWEEQERITNLHTALASGTLAPPMLYAQGMARPYVGPGDPLSKIEITSKIQGFSDFACEHPLP